MIITSDCTEFLSALLSGRFLRRNLTLSLAVSNYWVISYTFNYQYQHIIYSYIWTKTMMMMMMMMIACN